MQRILSSLALLLVCGSLAAQKIENVKATLNGDDIIITYDLTGTAGQEFKINLYASNSNFSKPIIKASGDIGSRITPGKDKRVVWNAKNELPEYKGDLVIEVRGEAGVVSTSPTSSVRPLSFLSPTGGGTKRGKTLSVSWTGGTPAENVELSLMKDGAVQQKLTDQSNNGAYTWQVPKGTKTGSYQLKLTGSSSGMAMSTNFKVKPSVPLLLKILPVVAVGGIVAVLVSGGGGKKKADLPVPPEPN
jgi:hypothetical protein